MPCRFVLDLPDVVSFAEPSEASAFGGEHRNRSVAIGGIELDPLFGARRPLAGDPDRLIDAKPPSFREDPQAIGMCGSGHPHDAMITVLADTTFSQIVVGRPDLRQRFFAWRIHGLARFDPVLFF